MIKEGVPTASFGSTSSEKELIARESKSQNRKCSHFQGSDVVVPENEVRPWTSPEKGRFTVMEQR